MKIKGVLNVSFLIVNLFLTTHTISAQPNIEWEKNYGGSAFEFASSVKQTTDGGYAIAGISRSADGDVSGNNGEQDYWIVKLDIEGNIEWENNYGGSMRDHLLSMELTTDGGYILVGRSESNDGDVSKNNGGSDCWIVKLDAEGNLEWEKTYGGTSPDIASSVKQTTDGGYIVGARTSSSDGDVGGNNGGTDYWILKLDTEGNLEWENNYGGSGGEILHSIQQTTDGGYIVAGNSGSNDGDLGGNNGGSDYWIVKLDLEGNIEWEQNYGGSEGDTSPSIAQTTDDGYIVAGTSRSNNGDVSGNNGELDYWVLKLDIAGNQVWGKNFGGVDDDFARSIAQTTDGGYIAAGSSRSNDGDVSGNNGGTDYWILKLDMAGNIEWEKNYGGSDDDYIRSIAQTTDGGYIVAGESSSIDGDVSGNNGLLDFWVIKLAPFPLGIPNTLSKPKFTISPNPSQGEFTINMTDLIGPMNVRICNAVGRTVYIKSDIEGELNVDNIPPGNYFITITSEDHSGTRKLIIH